MKLDATESITTTHHHDEQHQNALQRPHWSTLLTWGTVAAMLLIALFMRLYLLDAPFDRDSYDEGVYWQSLRAMSDGGSLYYTIFYSQPPFFLLSIYPFFLAFGQSLWAARMGIALISLLGFLGMLLLGRSLAGRRGMLAGLLLLLIDPLYLFESQTLQAEIPAVALSLLSVALAYLWWEQPTGRRGYLLAILTTMTLALSILAKLLTVSTLIPIALLALAHLWRTFRQPPETRRAALLPLLVGVLSFILTTLAVLLPFSGAFPQFWSAVVTFHTDASVVHQEDAGQSVALLQQALNPFKPYTTPIGNLHSVLFPIMASLGTIIALWRRDWRVLPLLAWLLTTLLLLRQQVPLFQHHLVSLSPPFIALIIMAFARPARPVPNQLARPGLKNQFTYLPTIGIIILIACTFCINSLSIQHYYVRTRVIIASDNTKHIMQIANDIRQQLKPGELLITDALFISGLADADTPHDLVDLSRVRIRSGYATDEQLIKEATRPEVRAILVDNSGRLAQLTVFNQWVREHCRLVKDYGDGRTLWVKI